ncbi:MAG: hypothetical protein P4L55_17940 [Syntrophobacteraceae bacterium]|nr:hypothetical protein [Syntrophobacteraceae bacterium]
MQILDTEALSEPEHPSPLRNSSRMQIGDKADSQETKSPEYLEIITNIRV